MAVKQLEMHYLSERELIRTAPTRVESFDHFYRSNSGSNKQVYPGDIICPIITKSGEKSGFYPPVYVAREQGADNLRAIEFTEHATDQDSNRRHRPVDLTLYEKICLSRHGLELDGYEVSGYQIGRYHGMLSSYDHEKTIDRLERKRKSYDYIAGAALIASVVLSTAANPDTELFQEIAQQVQYPYWYALLALAGGSLSKVTDRKTAKTLLNQERSMIRTSLNSALNPKRSDEIMNDY